jgi:type I restriction enzyme, S subunit
MITKMNNTYKETEIGVIPSDWEVIPIDDILNFEGGSQPPRDTFKFEEQEDYIRLLQIRDYKTDKYASYIPSHLARKKCEKDDIMIGRYGPPIFQILRGFEGAYNVALIKAIPKQKITKEFGWFILTQKSLFEFVEKLSQRSSGQTGVDLNELKKYQIPLPIDKAEQTAIATALSDTDSYIASLEKLIAKKRLIKQGAMQQLLKPKEGWVVKTFRDICWVNQGLQIAIENRVKYPNEKSKIYITIQFLNDGKEIEYIDDYSNSVCCEEDDILMTRTGNTGFVISGVSGVFHNNFFKINFDKSQVIREYLIYYLKDSKTQKLIMDKAGTSTIPDLNHSDFYSIPIPLPQTKAEQANIASALSDMDTEIETLEKQLSKAKSIKQGMMQQLLTGKIRLV